MSADQGMSEAQREYQRAFYDRHFPKRAAAVRSQLAHPLLSSLNDRVAGLVLDVVGGSRSGPDRPARVFEPGCGEGLLGAAFGREAARRGMALSYTGADLSEGALGLARSAVDGDLRLGDATEVTAALAAGSQDVIVAKNLLHHLDDPAGFLQQAARALAPGGRVVAFEPRLGCPQFLLFNLLAARRERHYFRGQRRNAAAFEKAGLRVLSCDRFSWLPYELAFVIRPEVFRRLFPTGDPERIAKVSALDDSLAASVPWLACYAVWVAVPPAHDLGGDVG